MEGTATIPISYKVLETAATPVEHDLPLGAP